jgi:arylsulfatase A-like enzyme
MTFCRPAPFVALILSTHVLSAHAQVAGVDHAEADRLVGRVIEGLKEAAMWDRTILLITADHGGKGKTHGGATMDEIEIPWILHGPGVAAGHELSTPVNTYDTAATVAAIFSLTPPDCWIGRPVRTAFETPH